ncbi:alpha/beta hydrolase [Parachlamydia acanthamoebae]|jgi:alpha/beta superfamily hydrolase|uniref:alpha/beta hydrolase n=1 Tax=Parachlamydia acanthamoebae TaxID=83552 RepID=UPI0024E1B8F0|nr:alpha/beta fold hydrolase [Parachlamydia acanthamoebae]
MQTERFGSPVFSVQNHQDIFKIQEKKELEKAKKSKITHKLLAPLFFLPRVAKRGLQKLVGKIILPSQFSSKKTLDEYYDAATGPLFSKNQNRFTIQTADGVKLDTMTITHASEAAKDPKDQKWLVFFNGNGMTYEEMVPELQILFGRLGVNIYTGNYRGVGYSEKSPSKAEDLVIDGEAMVQYLLNQGIQPENIVLYGWSLGGAVATHVAALHQNEEFPEKGIRLVNDRSFSTLKKEVSHLLPVIGGLASRLIGPLKWNLNSLENWKKIDNNNKALLFHKDDPVIPYKASLYKGLKESSMSEDDKKAKKERRKFKAKKRDYDKNYPQDYKPDTYIRSRGKYNNRLYGNAHVTPPSFLDVYDDLWDSNGISLLDTIRKLLNIQKADFR